MNKMRIGRYLLLPFGLVALQLAGCHKADRDKPDHPRLAPGVELRDVTFYSNALRLEMPYRVFLPANLADGEKLPVVYLLHGGNGSFRDWSNYSDVAGYATQGLILVMPEGAFSYYQNAVLNPEDKFEDYLVYDLISDVESRFPTAKGRENRAIVGISMGGFAAIKLALCRPDLFVFVGAFSPSIDILHRRLSLKRIGEWWRIRTIFGPRGSASRQSSDPFVLVQSASPASTPYIYLTAGDREPLLEPNRRFESRLRQRQFVYEFHTRHGGHDWGEWDSQIPGCFDSLLARLGGHR